MKKLILFLLFSNPFWLYWVNAQTPSTLPYNYNFDSLVNVNDRYKKMDIFKLKTMNQIALAYAKVNPTKGIEIGEQAVALAQKTNPNGIFLAEAFNNKGLNHSAKSEYTMAMELYEKALNLNQSLGNNYGTGYNTYNIGEIYRLRGDRKKARELFEKVLTGFEEINDKAGIAKACNGLGNIYLNSADYLQALNYYQRALSITEQLADKGGMASILGNMGNVYSNLSDYPQALGFYQRSLVITEQLSNKRGMASILGNIGIVYQNLSEYPKALEYYQKALVLNEQLGNKIGMALNLGNMGGIYRHLSDYPKALEYHQKSLTISEQLANKSSVAINLGNIGSIYLNLSDYTKALEYYEKAIVLNEQIGAKNEIAANLGNIGNVYRKLSNYIRALEYHQKALLINEQSGNKRGMAINMGNIGIVYRNLSNSDCEMLGISPSHKYHKALEYYQKAMILDEQLGDKGGMAAELGNMGIAYRDAPDSVLISLGITPNERYTKVLEYTNRALEINKGIGNLEGQKINWESLSIMYEKQGNYTKAHQAYKNYIVLRDSTDGTETKKKINQKEMQFEYEKKETLNRAEFQRKQDSILFDNAKREFILQKEMQLEALKYEYEKKQAAAKSEKERQQLKFEEEMKRKQINYEYEQKTKAVELEFIKKQALIKAEQDKKDALARQELEREKLVRNGFVLGFAGMLFFTGVFFRQRNKIKKGKKRSDELLLNILPEEVAEELKETGSTIAKLFDEVTVMFTDFKDFTVVSEKLTPTELVAEIHTCFKAFDDIITKYNIEKIKTIGDSYMCVAGLPNISSTHASDMIKAALEMREFIGKYNREKSDKGDIPFEIRIGLHTGPVVAGIVGVKKFAYDIWGDTVNLASRMETNSEPGKINISGATYELVKNQFKCEYRGKIEAKNKGLVDMYFVE